MDWATAASLATAVGTLVLAVATFVSVRSANRAARVAERTLLAGIRPLLVPSRLQDPEQKVGFADNRWVRVPGGQGATDVSDEAIFLVVSLRNVGSGLGVLHGWHFAAGQVLSGDAGHAPWRSSGAWPGTCTSRRRRWAGGRAPSGIRTNRGSPPPATP